MHGAAWAGGWQPAHSRGLRLVGFTVPSNTSILWFYYNPHRLGFSQALSCLLKLSFSTRAMCLHRNHLFLKITHWKQSLGRGQVKGKVEFGLLFIRENLWWRFLKIFYMQIFLPAAKTDHWSRCSQSVLLQQRWRSCLAVFAKMAIPLIPCQPEVM